MRTNRQNKRLWALVRDLARIVGGRAEAEAIMRDMVEDLTGRRSTKNLNARQAAQIVQRLEEQARPADHGAGPDRFENLAGRAGMATPRQLRMLEALAADALKGKTLADRRRALNKICKRQTGAERLEWLQREDVTPVKEALIRIGERNGRDLSGLDSVEKWGM
jgi:hypothetical protein